MSEANPTLLVVGAHPDDCDFSTGGTAALWARAGRQVHFLSLTNGDAGHHITWGSELAARRKAEAAHAAAVLGVHYDVWDVHDGYLEATIPLRLELIRAIHRLNPDVVICPRLWDYHPDHRAASQLVQDASYLLMVPAVANDVPPLTRMPIILNCWDHFREPSPFRCDVIVDIESVLNTKVEALACHESQVFEWLPHVDGHDNAVPTDRTGRIAMLRAVLEARAHALANDCLPTEKQGCLRFAEAFQLSEYGRQVSFEELGDLFGLAVSQ